MDALQEAFAIAEDREQVLATLIPGTAEHAYYHCLHYQHTGRLDEVERAVADWRERHGHDARLQQILDRQLLLRYADQPDETLDALRRRLNLSFPHQREARSGERRYPTALDPAVLERAALLREGRTRPNLGGFTESALAWLAGEQLDGHERRQLLERLPRPDLPGLVDLVIADLQWRHSGGFGSLRLHTRLLDAQLDELARRVPDLMLGEAFVHARLMRLRPGPDEPWAQDPNQRSAYLERLRAFVMPLAPAFNPLKAHVLYHLLDQARRQDRFELEDLLAYLRLPRPVSYAPRAWLERPAHAKHPARLGVDFSALTELPTVHEDEELVRAHLAHHLRDADGYQHFSEMVRDAYLQKLFARTKLLAGVSDPQAWYALLSPAEHRELAERVELRFAPTCRDHFRADEAVSVDVELKRVPTLTIKVFPINAFAYFLERGGEVDLSLDLDGLVAAEEHTHEFAEPGLQRVRRRFTLPALSRPGVYVVELIGGGLSCRALIRKGTLRALDRVGAAGQVIRILDEDAQPLPEATLWLAQREYRPDAEGCVRLPFSTRPGETTALLRHGDLAVPWSFAHRAEEYSLDAGLHVERERLLAGRRAEVLVRATLRLHGAPVDPSLLREPCLAITTTDRQGVSSTREVKDLELSYEAEAAIPFTVPADLSSLHVSLQGEVQLLGGETRSLSAARSYSLNGIEASDRTEQVHLARTAAGFVLSVLGKSGEPRADRVVTVQLHHRDLEQPIAVPLQSDAGGRIELGVLPGVVELEAIGPGELRRRFRLQPEHGRYPRRIQVEAGERIVLPYPGPAAEPSRAAFSLLQRGPQGWAADHFARIARGAGTVELEGLPPGEHRLVLKQLPVALDICVAAGARRLGWIATPTRLLEAGSPRHLAIAALEADAEELRVRLVHASPAARLHLVGTRFLPAHPLAAELGQTGRGTLRREELARAASEYVSGRDIGDEYRYVLERRGAETFPGNMLTRPGLLLSPWSVSETATGVANAAAGGSYGIGAKKKAKRARRAKADRARGGAGQAGGFVSLEFLPQAASLHLNLRPDAEGWVRLPRAELAGTSLVRVLAVDGDLSVLRELPGEAAVEGTRDLRLRAGLDPTGHFSEQRRVSVLAPGERLRLDDLRTAEHERYDSLARVFELFRTLSGNEELARFAFLLRWPHLDPAEQRARYSEFACHELNLFLAHKDPEFFRTVIQPYLANKSAKTFVDRYLLQEDLSSYLEPWAYGRLNTAERILLARRLPEEAEATRRLVEERCERLPRDPEREAHRFRTALRSGALDAEPAPPETGAGLLMAMAAPAAPPPPPGAVASRSVKLMELADEESEAGFDMDDAFGGGGMRGDLGAREEMSAFFRSPERTQELAESDYYRLRRSEESPERVPVNAFWRDCARHRGPGPFLSPHLAEATSNLTEMLLALSVLDLPFQPEEPQETRADEALELEARSPCVVFHQEIKPAEPAAEPLPILVGQNIFRRNDRYRYERGERRDKYAGPELLVHEVYLCQVVITNPTSSRQKLELLLQIPAGAIPVADGFVTRGRPLWLEPYATQSVEYSFYFPLAGDYGHFPAHVSRNGRLIASAAPQTLRVVEQPSQVDRSSWRYISQEAEPDELLRFLAEEPLEGLDLNKIAWRLQDGELCARVLDLLARRHRYDATLWSYALLHGQPGRIAEYLRHEGSLLASCGLALESGLVRIDPVERGRYEHLEYAPLINARAHPLGGERRILNDRFARQYERFLRLLCERPGLGAPDRLALCGYLFLQDRVAEGLAMLERVEREDVAARLQLDYLRAYGALYRGQPGEARAIAQPHAEHPVERWRQRFQEVLAQVAELEGAAPGVVDPEALAQRQTELAAREPSLELRVEGRELVLEHRNLERCRLGYYLMDVELLFSRQPFVQQQTAQFAFVAPNRVQELELSPEGGTRRVELPPELHSANGVVEAVGAGLRVSLAHYAHRLRVELSEAYGQLRVARREGGQPLATTYVKCFARMQGGQVRFYKDGYTDLRGRFDYASLSTDELDRVERFALLILHPEEGAVIREASPPKR